MRTVNFSVNRFDHIVMNCRNVEITAEWYSKVLGMQVEKFGPHNRTALRFGDQKINLRPLGAELEDSDWTTARSEAAGSEDLCFITSFSPEDVGTHLAACGVKILKGPVVKMGALGEMNSLYCRDPEGNLIEISSYL